MALQYMKPDKLFSSICALVLCEHDSLMAEAVRAVVKAHRFGLTVELIGEGLPGFNLLCKALCSLGMDFQTSILEDNDYWSAIRMPLDAKSLSEIKAVVPPMNLREEDISCILPFCIQWHLERIRATAPDYPEPRVDNIYLTQVWKDSFCESNPLSPRVYHDLLSVEDTGILTLSLPFEFNSSTLLSARIPADRMKDWLDIGRWYDEHLTDRAIRYLGFTRGNPDQPSSYKSPVEGHPFNALGEECYFRWSERKIEYDWGIWLIQRWIWDLQSLSVVARNAAKLNNRAVIGARGLEDGIDYCIDLRLQGLDDSEIQSKLNWKEPNFSAFLEDACLTTESDESRDWLSEWTEACLLFGLEPDIGLLESEQVAEIVQEPATTPSDTGLGSDTEQVEVSSDFEANDEYTRVWYGGKPFDLNFRQSSVIKMLHEAAQSKYPKIHKVKIFEGVLSDNYEGEPKIRDWFKGNIEAYRALVRNDRKGNYWLYLSPD